MDDDAPLWKFFLLLLGASVAAVIVGVLFGQGFLWMLQTIFPH